MMIWGAAMSGTATGFLTATLIIIWTTVTGA